MLCPRYIDNKYRQVKCIFSPSATFFFAVVLLQNKFLFCLHFMAFYYCFMMQVKIKMKIMIFFSALILLVVHLLVIVNSWHGKQSVVKKIVWVKKIETQTRGTWMNFFLRNWGSFKFFMSWVTFCECPKSAGGVRLLT